MTLSPDELETKIGILEAALYNLVNAVDSRQDVGKYVENAWMALDWSPDVSIEDRENARKRDELTWAKRDTRHLVKCLSLRAVNHVPISPRRMMAALKAYQRWGFDPERHYDRERLLALSQEANEAITEFHQIAFKVGVFDSDIPF
jgi:hypothetical protein